MTKKICTFGLAFLVLAAAVNAQSPMQITGDSLRFFPFPPFPSG